MFITQENILMEKEAYEKYFQNDTDDSSVSLGDKYLKKMNMNAEDR